MKAREEIRGLHLPQWVFSCLLFFGVAGYSGWLCHALFGGIPRIDDSVATVYQARLFAEGMITTSIPVEIKLWFEQFGVISPLGRPGELTSMYPPGMSLLFLPFTLLGVVWLSVPICGGLLALTICALAQEMFDHTTSRVAGLLALVSPYFTVVSATHLSHVPATLLMTLAWYNALVLLRAPSLARAVVTGACVGACILVRSETALLVGCVIALLYLVEFRRSLKIWRLLLVAAFVAALGLVCLTLWQHFVFGKAGVTGHELQLEEGAEFGIGITVGESYEFSRQDANNHAVGRGRALLDSALGWPVPVEFFLLLPIFLGAGRWRVLWLCTPFAVLSALFYHFWYWEEWLPGRYLFPALPFLLVAAAWGIVCLGRMLRDVPVLRSVPAFVLAGAMAWSVLVASPELHKFFRPHHADVEDWLPKIVAANGISNALIFTARESTLRGATYNNYYATGFRLNSLNRDGSVVYVRDGADKTLRINNEDLIAHYPGRSYYLYTYNQRNRLGRIAQLEVVDGKITGQTVLPWTGITLK